MNRVRSAMARARRCVALPVTAGALACFAASPAPAQITRRVSVDSAGMEGSLGANFAAISADGRWVAFESGSNDLVPFDTNSASDVFVHDRQTGTTTRVSVSSSGTEGNSGSQRASISGDGRYIAFMSFSGNFVPGDTNGQPDVFVHDQQTGQTSRVDVSSAGVQTDFASGVLGGIAISADGRFVAFNSSATNLVPGDTNGSRDVFVRDLQLGLTYRVSVDSAGAEADSHSSVEGGLAISADGRYVAFESNAANLVTGDTNAHQDVFVHDRQTGSTNRASVDSSGTQGNNESGQPVVSDDGRFVAFESVASNLVPGGFNGMRDVYVHDFLTGTTARVSVSSGGASGNGVSFAPSISADGRFVAYWSLGNNLVPGDTNNVFDVFLRDRQTATTTRVSVSSHGTQGNGVSSDPSVSADARYVAFESFAANLAPGDTNGDIDVFVRDRAATGFTSHCDPGTNGVIACPCSNAPSGPMRGCDNSSSTGGASLSASGAAYLSLDELVFTATGEKPTATSILMQGNAFAASGLVFGQGVRCAAGTLKRLYTKTASAGSVSMPDAGAGDPSVSARSAALGDVIQAGESRWYLVYYRDPTVLGGCPAGSTFNATQTGRIDWSL